MEDRVQCAASTCLVDPAPPTDMEHAVCPSCGAFVALIGKGEQARWDTHLERVPLRDRFGAPPVADRGDVLDYELSRAAGWDAVAHLYEEAS